VPLKIPTDEILRDKERDFLDALGTAFFKELGKEFFKEFFKDLDLIDELLTEGDIYNKQRKINLVIM
jgi:hypothetical protein